MPEPNGIWPSNVSALTTTITSIYSKHLLGHCIDRKYPLLCCCLENFFEWTYYLLCYGTWKSQVYHFIPISISHGNKVTRFHKPIGTLGFLFSKLIYRVLRTLTHTCRLSHWLGVQKLGPRKRVWVMLKKYVKICVMLFKNRKCVV